MNAELPEQSVLSHIPWNNRAIMLLDLDAFFASVEQMDHPDWKGKPVIVGGDPAKRGVVSTCSYEARKYGVHSAMPSSTAARLCPQAIWTSGNRKRYVEVSNRVMEILRQESPFMQQVSIDEAFLDITPGTHIGEHPITIALRIQDKVNALGVTCSIGLGTSKTVAKIASDMDKPRGFTVVYPGEEAEFLAPLPIACMSGIGQASQTKLTRYGITTLGQLHEADPGLMASVFGKNAELMRNRCIGVDPSPVAEDDQMKSISSEMSFAEDLVREEDVKAAIGTAAAKVARRLRREGVKASTVTLKLRFHNLKVHTAQMQLSKETDSEYDLLQPLYKLLGQAWEGQAPLRLVGVAASGFDRKPCCQQSLFDMEDEETHQQKRDLSKLAAATDAIRDRFGDEAISFGKERRTNKNLTGTQSKN